MRGRLIGLVAAAILGAAPVLAVGPEGVWLTEDGTGVIAIAACDGGLCGRIVGMRSPRRPDGSASTDSEGRPMCGLGILRAAPEGTGAWAGRISNPDDGSSWHCTLHVDAAGRLNLRGYVLVPLLGQTQVWTRYTGRVDAGCAMQD